MKTITRKIEIDAGHRLKNHESKCRNVHGHRYVFEVTCAAESLDAVGRVIDFGKVKAILGGWLDENWDHGFIYQFGDKVGDDIAASGLKVYAMVEPPTAENMVTLFHEVAATLMGDLGIQVVNVRLWETPNCYADSNPPYSVRLEGRNDA
jgi:6-pyruvoyltetrahydropterin/6-carboxytetrahydropterin synthase